MLQHIPNLISVIRILLVVPICYAIWQDEYPSALMLIIIAGISDGVDGFLARRFHWTSRLGSILDPAADKLLLMSIFIVLGFKAVFPWWLIIIVLVRDIIIVFGAIAYQYITHRLEVRPLFIGKLHTVILVVAVSLALYELAIQPIASWLIPLLTILITIMTIVTGLTYIILWSSYTQQVLQDKATKMPPE